MKRKDSAIDVCGTWILVRYINSILQDKMLFGSDWPVITPDRWLADFAKLDIRDDIRPKVLKANARKLLARSLPLPTVKARRTARDFEPDGDLTKTIWQRAEPVRLEYQSRDYTARPDLSTTVRVLWSETFVYFGYECPFTKLTVFEPAQANRERFDLEKEGMSLWDRDVVEAFIGDQPRTVGHYAEFEVAPSNERLDVMVDLPKKDFEWDSQFRSAVRINKGAGTWTCEMRIPIKALGGTVPASGTRWRLNLFRCDRANKAALAWSPALTGSFHSPERFGALEFVE